MDKTLENQLTIGRSPSRTRQKRVALIGIVLVVIGVFVPVYKEGPVTVNFYDLNEDNNVPADGLGVSFIIIAAVSLLLILMDRLEYLWLPFIFLFWILLIEFRGSWTAILNSDFYLYWGWIFLGAGVLLMSVPLWWSAIRERKWLFNEEEEEPDDVE